MGGREDDPFSDHIPARKWCLYHIEQVPYQTNRREPWAATGKAKPQFGLRQWDTGVQNETDIRFPLAEDGSTIGMPHQENRNDELPAVPQ